MSGRLSKSLVFLGTVGFLAFCTCPSADSFRPFLEEWLKDQLETSNNGNGIGSFFSGMTASLVSRVAVTNMRNYYLMRVAAVQAGNETIVFAGLFNHWFSVGSLPNSW